MRRAILEIVAVLTLAVAMLVFAIWRLRWVIIAVLVGWYLIGWYTVSQAQAEDQPYHSRPDLPKWIPATCCVTNYCCWEIQEREVRALPDDEWEIRSTGQVRKRTAFSPDGKFYRCACDYDNVDKHWVKHQGANTRCIFVPMRSASVPGGFPVNKKERPNGPR